MIKGLAIIFAIEMAVGAAAGGIAAAILLPIAYRARGTFAVGGEWGAIFIIAYIAFLIFHKYIFKQIERSVI